MQAIGTTSKRTALGYAACAMAGTLWGTGFFWGRLALNEMSVEHLIFYRFAFASLGMLPVLLLLHPSKRFTWAEIRALLIAAALGIPVQFLLQFHGLARTTVSHAALMVGSFPVMLAVAATLFAGERLDRFGWLALASSTMGAGLIVIGSGHSNSASGQPSSTGDLMVVASLATSIVWTLTSKKLMERHRSLEVSVYSTLSGFVMLAAWVLLSPLALNPGAHLRIAAPPVHFSATAWTALIFSGLLCTATTTLLWNWGIHRVPASRAGVFLNLEPAIGAWLGMQFLGERLGAWAWVGGALILTSALALTARGLKTQPDLILD